MTLAEIRLEARRRLNITELNPMQQRMAGVRADNIVLLAPTGSGKTLAFAIALLQRLKAPTGYVQALVLAPSRELVLQTAGVLRALAGGYRVTAFYGGHRVADEVNTLRGGIPDIVVATPGRLVDHLTHDRVDLGRTPILVVDEYDKQLELGFEAQMRRIVRMMPARRVTILTSATPLAEMPEYLRLKGSVERLDYTTPGEGLPALTCVEVPSPTADKLDTLTDLLTGLDNGKCIIFVNHRDAAERVFRHLKRHSLPVVLYHGGLDQPLREQAVITLGNGTTPVMVATDLAARGLDIESVDNVVHYHMPVDAEAWTHRNGRAGRQGRPGTVYAITAEGDTLPDNARFARSLTPSGRPAANPLRAAYATVHVNVGRRDKVSRGDILGWLHAALPTLPQHGGVGRIDVGDRQAFAAIPAALADEARRLLPDTRLKNKRVRVTVL